MSSRFPQAEYFESPPQQEEGWPRNQEEAAKPPLMEQTGWCGKEFLDHTTPSARTNEASRFFLIVQPPLLLLRRGASPSCLLVVSFSVLRNRGHSMPDVVSNASQVIERTPNVCLSCMVVLHPATITIPRDRSGVSECSPCPMTRASAPRSTILEMRSEKLCVSLTPGSSRRRVCVRHQRRRLR